jgi:superfamily II DNA or RNA helicase
MALSTIFIQIHFVSLRDSGLSDYARSSVDDSIVDSFENPALYNSHKCDRISGWWDIAWLDQASAGLESFFMNGGKMRLLIGVPIHSSLTKLVEAEKNKKYAMTFLQKLEETPELSHWKTFEKLQAILKSELVDIRILVVGIKRSNPKPEHAKIQIYTDNSDDRVGACGSKNDTRRGSEGGVDFMLISKSWESTTSALQIDALQDYFDSHWEHEDTASLTEVSNDPEFQDKLQKLSNKSSSEVNDVTKISRLLFNVSKDLIMVDLGKIQEYPAYISESYSGSIDTLTFEGDKTLYQYFIKKLIEYKPEAKLVIFSENNFDAKSICKDEDVDFLEFYSDDKKWYYNSKLEESSMKIEVIEFAEKILKFFDISTSISEKIPSISTRKPTHELVPDIITNYPYGEQLRPHYIRALRGPNYEGAEEAVGFQFENNIERGFITEKTGLFEHATGSGKTGLGLISAAHMLGEVDLVIIVCPKISIALQWWEMASKWFNSGENKNVYWSFTQTRPSEHWSSKKKNEFKLSHISVDEWEERLSFGKKYGPQDGLIITVDKTLFAEGLNQLKSINNLGKEYGIIFDEAHNLIQTNKTSINNLKQLNPSWKLGLTALFNNIRNPEGSQEVLNWISEANHTDNFSLNSALKSDYLKEYIVKYHFIESDSKEDFRSKSLNYVISNISDLTDGPTIFFSPASTVEELIKTKDKIDSDWEYSMTPEHFTYNHQHQKILDRWSKGACNPLLSLTILDEGISIDQCKSIILLDSSEDDSRQWIQRRGRALRKDSNPDSKAIIHDFLPFNHPDEESVANISDYSKNWINRNYKRIIEFISSAVPEEENFKVINLLSSISGGDD